VQAPGSARKPRSDGQRNRERLLEAAKAGFAASGVDASLEEIARRAGVGIGTLYRHFPTRDALVQAVYRREVEQLADSAARLLAAMPAGEALHRWMLLFLDYIATKKVLAAALAASVGGDGGFQASAGVRINEAISRLVQRAAADGAIRRRVEPSDLLRALAGISYGNTSPEWQASAIRVIDILMDGLRTGAGG
jgi:AcrR family transcriptional regulator